MRAAVITVLGLVMALLSPLAGLFGASAAYAAPLGSVPAVSVTVPAGGSATLQVRGLALQPGSLLPQGALALGQQTLATERVRTALYYGINWGYADTDPQQVALAVWWAQTGQWPETDHTYAQRIADAAAASPGLPTWLVDGRSLVSLVSQGQLSLASLSLAPASTSSFGIGTLTVRNSSGQDLLVYLPYGTVFTGANGSALVWAVAAGRPVPPEATATAAPVAPTDTPLPVATATAPDGYKPGYVPPTEAPTDTPLAEPPTATSEPPTATEVAPTDTPAPAQPADAPGSKEAEQNPAPEAPKAPPATTQNQQAAAAPQITVPAKTVEQPISGAASSNQQSSQQPPKSAATSPQNVLKQPGPVDTAVSPAAPIVDTPTPAKSGGSTGGPGAVGGPGAAPGPVGTTQPGTAPGPVETSQPGANQVPNPELTIVATVPVGKPTETPTAPVKTEPLPTEPPKVEPTLAAPEPTKAPIPEIPPNPIIDTTQGTPPTAADGSKGNASPPTGTGAAPTNNPTTGGGASSLPIWLSVFSALLVLGGWSLRRTANTAVAEAAVDEATEKQ